MVKKPSGSPGGFYFGVAINCNHNRDAAMQCTAKIQQFQGFIVAEMPRARGSDTSL
jgi:hypothetical protein